MFANWDWVSFLFGVLAAVVLGGGVALLVGVFNLGDL